MVACKSSLWLCSIVAVGCGGHPAEPSTDASVDARPRNVIEAAAPTIAGEVAVDGWLPGTTGTPANAQAIAFDGTNYLVVWADARDSNATDIWGARISATGAILDSDGIRIAAAPGFQADPAVAFDGTQFLVAWVDKKDGTESDIAAATVAVDGTVTALPAVATTPSSETAPAIASNGSSALLTWIADGQLVGARFTGSFGASFAITTGPLPAGGATLAARPGGAYLVAYTETSPATKEDIRGVFVSASGAVGTPFDIANGNAPERDASATFDGTNFDVVWSGNYTGVEIYGTRVTTAGTVLESHAEGARTIGGKIINSATGYQEAPSIACTGATCLVVWQDKRNMASTGYDVYGQRLTTGFALTGTDFIVADARLHQTHPSVVAGSGRFFTAWQDQRAGNAIAMRIAGTGITTAGAVLDPDGVVVNRSHNQEFAPALARDGTTLSIAWSDSRSLWGNDIEMVRADATGAVVDLAALAISDASYGQVAVASTGFCGQLLHVWSDARNEPNMYIYATRAAADGTMLDAAGTLVSQTTRANVTPQVASSGNEALIVWEDGTNDDSPTGDDVYGAIADMGGAISARFVISAQAEDQMRPAVAYDASTGQYVVAWADRRSGRQEIWGARVTPTGTVLDPGGVLLATGPTGDRLGVKLATVGSTLLAAYVEVENDDTSVLAVRIASGATLAVLDTSEIPISTEVNDQILPVVTTLDGAFLVVWSDGREPTRAHDIWAQRITTTGDYLGTPFVVSSGSEDETAPAAIDVTGTSVLVAYVKQLATGRRVYTRLLTPACKPPERY